MGRGTRPKARTDRKIIQNQRRNLLIRGLRREKGGLQATVATVPAAGQATAVAIAVATADDAEVPAVVDRIDAQEDEE